VQRAQATRAAEAQRPLSLPGGLTYDDPDFGVSSDVIVDDKTIYDRPMTDVLADTWGDKEFGSPCYRHRYVIVSPYYLFEKPSFSYGATKESGKYDYEPTVLHELGHVLGVADSYSGSRSSAVMYGYLGTGTVKRALPTLDRDAAVRKYGPK
jgi:hypothetical protein